jgi:predicted porin
LAASAQDFQDDAALWASITLEKKISKEMDLYLSQKSRINNNISHYGLGYIALGASYELNKHVKVTGEYRFAKKSRLDDSYDNRHRGSVALTLKQKMGSFTFLYRNLVLAQYKDIYSRENGTVPSWYERNKLTVKYELNKRIDFYVSEELYLPFYQAKSKGLDRSRTLAGAMYNLDKRSVIELYFGFQRELNAFGPTHRDYIYGVSYTHQF